VKYTIPFSDHTQSEHKLKYGKTASVCVAVADWHRHHTVVSGTHYNDVCMTIKCFDIRQYDSVYRLTRWCIVYVSKLISVSNFLYNFIESTGTELYLTANVMAIVEIIGQLQYGKDDEKVKSAISE